MRRLLRWIDEALSQPFTGWDFVMVLCVVAIVKGARDGLGKVCATEAGAEALGLLCLLGAG